MTTLALRLISEEQMGYLGRILADASPGGTVFALVGELGAGKTRLVKGMAVGLGIDPDNVTSPTFTMIAEHAGKRNLYHMDFYRLETNEEAEQLGVDDYFESDGICAVEWADRLPDILPPDAVRIVIKVTGDRTRDIFLETGHLPFSADVLGEFNPRKD